MFAGQEQERKVFLRHFGTRRRIVFGTTALGDGVVQRRGQQGQFGARVGQRLGRVRHDRFDVGHQAENHDGRRSQSRVGGAQEIGARTGRKRRGTRKTTIGKYPRKIIYIL